MIVDDRPLRSLLEDATSGTWGAPADSATPGLPVLRSTNIHDGRLVLDDVAFRAVSKEAAVRFALRDGDILVTTSSGSSELIGKNCLFHQPVDDMKYLFSNFTLRLRPDPTQILPAYLYYYLNSGRARNELKRVHNTTSGLRNLNTTLYLDQPVPIAPLQQQGQMVEILDRADALRRTRVEADRLAARILPALFYEMFGDPTTNPMGFKKDALGKLIAVRSGESLPSRAMDRAGEYPVYGGNGISGQHSNFLLEPPVVIIGRVGVYCGAVHYSDRKCWVTDNALYVSEKSDDLVDRYLEAALRLANLNQYAGRAGQPLISAGRIYPVEILVPPKRLQVLFARRVDAHELLISLQTRAGGKVSSIWEALLYQAFVGRSGYT